MITYSHRRRVREARRASQAQASWSHDEETSRTNAPKQAQPSSDVAHARQQALARRFTTPERELTYHTSSAPIDINLNSFRAVLEDLESAVTGWPWIASVKASARRADSLVEKAVFAAGTQVLGRLRNEPELVRLSREAYQGVLEGLRLSLVNGKCLTFGPVMITVESALIGLELIEVLVESQMAAARGIAPCLPREGAVSSSLRPAEPYWLSHFRMGAACFRIAGPEAFRSKFGLGVLRAKKANTLFVAAYDRERCFLDDDAWRTRPYRYHGRTYEDDLWHLLERIPTTFEEYDIMVAKYRADSVHCDSVESARRALLDESYRLWVKMVGLRTSLQNWFKHLETAFEETLIRQEAPSAALAPGSETLTEAFPRSFIFPDRRLAELLTIYWCYSMRLITSGLDVQRIHGWCQIKSSSHPGHTTGLPEDSSWEPFSPDDLDELADNICQSMEYIYRPGGPIKDDLFHHPATQPLRIAMFHYAYLNASASLDHAAELTADTPTSAWRHPDPVMSKSPPSRDNIAKDASRASPSGHSSPDGRSSPTASLKLSWCKAVLRSLGTTDPRTIWSEMFISNLYGTVEELEAQMQTLLSSRLSSGQAQSGGTNDEATALEDFDVRNIDRYRKIFLPRPAKWEMPEYPTRL